MAFYHRNGERKRFSHDFRQHEDVIETLCSLGNGPISPKSVVEQEKRIRREIANSNERRRMQSINAGFQSLRSLLPHREGEKLSKAAILQSIADYVCQLERERNTLLEESRNQFNSSNRHPRQLDASNVQADKDGGLENPAPKRKRLETVVDSTDEGIGSSSPRSESGEDIRQEIIELRIQLQQERELRRLREEQVRHLQCLVYAAEDETLDDKMVLQYHNPEDKFDALSGMNPGLETAFGSPHSQNSSQDVESTYELSLRESSPELSNTEVPEDLSGKNSSITFSYVSEFADMNMNAAVASSPISVDHSHFPVDVKPAKQNISTSRQNLETIVEAIRHVEGDHMFRDDPILPNLESQQSKKPDNSAAVEEYYLEQNQKCTNANLNKDLSFQHQIIRNAPRTQSRPGVIVPNIP